MGLNDEDDAREREGGEHWERETLTRLATAALAEQRRSRRWGILFKSLVLLYLFVVLFAVLNVGPLAPGDQRDGGVHTAVVDVSGLIMAGSEASADRLIQGLESAFEDPGTQGVLLRINSPGGSPVQAGMVYDAIGRLRELHPDIPVYAVATDLCASGGYYIAAAADRIYANQASMVGSIGVRMGGFGFVDAIENLGVERRLITAGENKALLDPFLPQDPQDVSHLESMVAEIHQQFVSAVERGRGDRLAEDAPVDLFSGLIWTGARAVEYGLIDELATPSQVAREVIGTERMVDFTPRKDLLRRFSDRIGATLTHTLKSDVLAPALR
ncbi:MAG: S49 family peptidase [Halofilum sp. (in: g-proteobacteria)]